MKYRYQFIDYKDGVNNLDMNFIHPNLFLLLGLVNQYCLENDIQLQLTSMYRSEEENRRIGAKSVTHTQGRAVDISIREELGWTYEKTQLLVDYLNQLVETEHLEEGTPNPFFEIGAISARDKVQRPIVVHNVGHGAHIHLQVRQTAEWLDKTHRSN